MFKRSKGFKRLSVLLVVAMLAMAAFSAVPAYASFRAATPSSGATSGGAPQARSAAAAAPVVKALATTDPVSNVQVLGPSNSNVAVAVGSSQIFYATCTDTAGNPEYQFWVFGPDTNYEWVAVQNYSTNSGFLLSNLAAGTYTVAVYAMDAKDVAVGNWPNAVYGNNTFVLNVGSTLNVAAAYANGQITATATSTNIGYSSATVTNDSPVYQFWLETPAGSPAGSPAGWFQSGAYSASYMYSFPASDSAASGTYQVVAYACDPHAPQDASHSLYAQTSVSTATVVSVSAINTIANIDVANGTALSAVGLPTTVGITESNSTTATASVAWNNGTPAYNATTADTYVFSGTITPPAGVTNPSSLTASVNVVVAAPVTYTVAYNANSVTATGTVPTDSNKYVSGATVNVLNNTGSLANAGYTFVGWSLTSNGTAISGATFTMPAGNTILYAVWTTVVVNQTFTVAYGANSATATGTVPTDSTQYTSGAIVTVKNNAGDLAIPNTGYTFGGWSLTPNGAAVSTFTLTGNTILYAVWTATPVTAIAATTGTAQVGDVLTAGAVTPASATVTYQWQESATANGTYTAITGATGTTYTPVAGDATMFIEVVATATGSYTGTATSAPTAAVAAEPLSPIAATAGTAQVGDVLTAGAVTPAGATVTYQWESNTGAVGAYEPITGATASTYTPVAGDAGYSIKVVATGTGGYTGTETSVAVGPVAAASTAVTVAAITETGATQVGNLLTAAVTPSGATAAYQWQESATANGTYTAIGTNSPTYTPVAGDVGQFIEVVVTGAGSYTGTATSAPTTAVVAKTPITAIGATTGTVQVTRVLIAGALTPSGATVTYQWQESATANGTYTAITGATGTTYTPVAGDVGMFIEVVATATGSYSGTATSAPVGPVAVAPPTFTIGSTSGTHQVGDVLTAGTLTPSGATVTYQWQESNALGGNYTAIPGATSSTYTPVAGDAGMYIEVVATGTGSYNTAATSVAVGPVAVGLIPITAAGITGTAQVGSVLTAGVTASGVAGTATYVWQESATANGTYTAIVGATSGTYTPVAGDVGQFIEVVATGSGSYSGTATSAPTAAVVAQTPITAAAVTGPAQVGSVLTAGVTPAGAAATATYQWKESSAANGAYANVANSGGDSTGTASTYTPVAADAGYYIEVVVTAGTGVYSGAATSAAVGPEAVAPTIQQPTISHTSFQVGGVLTASVGSETATYQWQEATSAGGTYTAITGATGTTYTLQTSDEGQYIEVVATGTGSYTGTATSVATSVILTPVTAVSITGTAQVTTGTLTAGTLVPSAATVTYQWKHSNLVNGTYTNVAAGGTSSIYVPAAGDAGMYIEVVVTGTGGYYGTATSAAVGPVAAAQNATAVSITGTAQVNNTLTAVVTPASSFTGVVTYAWQKSATAGGTYAAIAGATSSAYSPVAGDLGKFIEVVATGTTVGYTTPATSAPTAAVVAQTPITAAAITETGMTQVGNLLTAGTTPAGAAATATYVWQESPTGDAGSYTAIATGTTYTPVVADEGMFIEVVATGTGIYSGTATSAAVGPVAAASTTLTGAAISGTAQVASVLTAAVTPTGATVTYQWESNTGAAGAYEPITGATGTTYTPVVADEGYTIEVVATGTGSFTGSWTSAATAVVIAPTTLTGAAISGTAMVGSVLTASASPSATATYVWEESNAATGTYTAIAGATSGTYTPVAGDAGNYIEVVATGTGSFTGTATSAAVGPVAAASAAIGTPTISGTAQVASVLTAAVTPTGATVTYQWQEATSAAGTYIAISGATSSTYTPVAADATKYIEVVATGTGSYYGTATSAATAAVAAAPTPITKATITETGATVVGNPLTANVTPTGATVTYQWQESSTANGTYAAISGATSSTYTPVSPTDVGMYIEVVATATGSYSGKVTSAPIGPVAAV